MENDRLTVHSGLGRIEHPPLAPADQETVGFYNLNFRAWPNPDHFNPPRISHPLT